MDLREVWWRVSQRLLQRREERRFAGRYAVTSDLFYDASGTTGVFRAESFGIRCDVVPDGYRPGLYPMLLGGYGYKDFSCKWHAGFQTQGEWPLEPSYRLAYKQNDTVGDARCNWELNRHFQFPLLAADYLVTQKREFISDLKRQFDDWNSRNPFLWGISWTSVMEVAIRSISWMLTLVFLEKAPCGNDADREILSSLKKQLATGVLNMAGYVVRHRSRYSSANNHLLVEMAAVGLAGIAFGREEWIGLATGILGDEIYVQNSTDGVNLEMSLHYHAFVMEAYLLFMRAMRINGMDVPKEWRMQLGRMAEFLSHSMVGETIAMEFGDSDGGKIIDLAGAPVSYYNYVLQLASLETGRRFSSFAVPELTIGWLYAPSEIEAARKMPCYDNSRSRTFAEGGYTFLRSEDGKTVVGIDHAPLGFGSIAAHGHADAMSLQVFHAGRPVLVDSGTYLYHFKCPERDGLRSELAHNTVSYAGHRQAQMCGPFLWGKRGEVRLHGEGAEPGLTQCGLQVITIEGCTFDGCPMGRQITFDYRDGSIEITDAIHSPQDVVSFIAVGRVAVTTGDRIALGDRWFMKLSGQTATLESVEISPRYGEKAPATAIRLHPAVTGESRVRIYMGTAKEME